MLSFPDLAEDVRYVIAELLDMVGFLLDMAVFWVVRIPGKDLQWKKEGNVSASVDPEITIESDYDNFTTNKMSKTIDFVQKHSLDVAIGFSLA
jgi:hypothetical protein